MVNAMTKEGNLGRITRPRLIPQIRHTIVRETAERRSWIEEDAWIARDDTEVLEGLLERLLEQSRLSKKEKEFNLRVLHIREIALNLTYLAGPIREKYGCGWIMALSLAIKEIRRCVEETKQFLREVSHPEDKQALQGLIYLLHAHAPQTYWESLVEHARTVDAVLSVNDLEKPNLELIEARFALDSIWDEERSMLLGAPERLRRGARKMSGQLDGDPNVAKTRRSLNIPPDGFKDLDAAHQWAQSEKRPPDWSCRDDVYWQQLVWWESFTWNPHWERHVARGYIMLDLPPMNEAVEQILDEHQWHRRWYRVLPLYLIRGRLEPPPRERYRRRPRGLEFQEIYELSERYKPCFKAVMYFWYRLSDEDWSEITDRYPAAGNRRWSPAQKQGIKSEAKRIAKRKGTYKTRRNWLTEDYVRKIRERMRALE